ncbi:hypothetical protein CONLIGDRAFT_650604 [Coniochaeta ligniaria NRRL 30616]|uniref:Uncharacterized protein n=1 Tax=Coniochaeta ligniaria NRRL 30616 TaxID=1408157 RepID=A0A1J7IMP3_9PEZI|nr:hypothetical protein CONLIGDRAFT_650604 [Coniochaeta ligniaria NRRL 30616]
MSAFVGKERGDLRGQDGRLLRFLYHCPALYRRSPRVFGKQVVGNAFLPLRTGDDMDFPDDFCLPLPLAVIASLKGRPHHFVHPPRYLMATTGFDPSSIGGVEADHESDYLQTPYQKRYQTAVGLRLVMTAASNITITDREQVTRWKPTSL